MKNWTKVYSGPGYPIDPERERKRHEEEYCYSCVIVDPPDPIILKSKRVTLTFDTYDKFIDWILARMVVTGPVATADYIREHQRG